MYKVKIEIWEYDRGHKDEFKDFKEGILRIIPRIGERISFCEDDLSLFLIKGTVKEIIHPLMKDSYEGTPITIVVER